MLPIVVGVTGVVGTCACLAAVGSVWSVGRVGGMVLAVWQCFSSARIGEDAAAVLARATLNGFSIAVGFAIGLTENGFPRAVRCEESIAGVGFGSGGCPGPEPSVSGRVAIGSRKQGRKRENRPKPKESAKVNRNHFGKKSRFGL